MRAALVLIACHALAASGNEIIGHDDGLPPRAVRENGYLGGAHTFTTLVVNRFSSCGNWARENECNGPNSDHVRRVCPMSCNQALAGMRDTHKHCTSWALQGACTNNTEFMRNTCPVTCGWAIALCKDLSSACPRLAKRGLCQTDPAHTLTMCSESCGVCRSSCRDTSTSCPGWVLDDWSTDNPATVLPRCSASAAICHELKIEDDEDVSRDLADEEQLARRLEAEGEDTQTEAIEKRMIDEHFPICEDHNKTLCGIWTRHACAMNPGSVIRLCPRMCGACDNICSDHVHSCHSWAAEGRLTPDLYHLCAATAGICSRVEAVLHYEEKDEL